MLKFFLFFIVVGGIGQSQAMRETCSASHVSYSDGARFDSVKEDGTIYKCHCSSRNCYKLTCWRSQQRVDPVTQPPPTSESGGNDDEDSITGEVPGSSNQDRPVHPIIRFVPSTSSGGYSTGGETCRDEQSGRTFRRGQTFIRLSTGDQTRKSCKCPTSGSPIITCVIAGCDLPSPPLRQPRYNQVGGCYDAWNDEEYESGSTYNRTRYMDNARQITGVYSCTCRNGFMRCSAVDIPCCDQKTGQFTPRGQRFTTIHAGLKMECTCEGDRGRYSTCLRPDGRNPFGPGGRLITSSTRPRYQSIPGYSRGSGKCPVDKWNNVAYSVGASYTQDRGSRGIWACRCARASTRYQTLCHYSSPSRYSI